jgi:hypothetical protein
LRPQARLGRNKNVELRSGRENSLEVEGLPHQAASHANCDEARNAGGRSRMVFTTPNTTMLTPIPKARIGTATQAKADRDAT